MNSSKGGTTTVRFRRQLPLASLSKLAQAAALAPCLDVRPLAFCDDRSGVHYVAHNIFEKFNLYHKIKLLTKSPIFQDVLL